MKKYLSFFRLRFSMGLQYRAAAIAGVFTQFGFGFMFILVYRAFYKADASAFPMTIEATTTYIWVQQAFLVLFMAWFMENEIFNAITNGDIAYEICRPVDIYKMWFSRSLANRLSKAVLRCMPILLLAFLLPKPYRLMIPNKPLILVLFVISMGLALCVTVALSMIIYFLIFFTISPMGIRMLFVSLVDFLAGQIIPLPFFPDNIRKWIELLPFASMQNTPLRIFSQDIRGTEIIKTMSLQIFWLIILIIIGKVLNAIVLKKVVVQGG